MLLTRPVEKRITDDWLREIPSLGIYRPRHLLRRAGPLLIGICLERDSGGDVYKPMFHVHCLGLNTPTVFLTLFTQLRSDHSGGPDFIQVRFHEESYKDAAARMVRQAPLPLAGDVRLALVLEVYREYLATPIGLRQRATLRRDMIVLSAWAGDQAGAEKRLNECLQDADEAAYTHVGGRLAFLAECRKLIENPAEIQRTAETQIAALGVGKLPVSRLLS